MTQVVGNRPFRAHKIRLSPTVAQSNYFLRCAGIARFAFNWMLLHSEAFYRTHGKAISDKALSAAWNAHRKAELPWTYEVTKWACNSGYLSFRTARQNWFRDLAARKKNPKCRMHFRKPRLKHKKRARKSFTLYEFKCADRVLTVPKLGAVKMTESVRFPGKIKSVTISEKGGHWFASFLVELPDDYVYPHNCETQAVVGVDVGLNAHVMLSTGECWVNPKLYRRYDRKLKKLHRALSRKKKGSRNREKARLALNRFYARVNDLRSGHLHQITTSIVKRFRHIGIEDLNIKVMLKNRKLSRAIADASFGELRRQLEYKAKFADCAVAVADRFFPSSKLCSGCGYKNDALKQGDRSWNCPQCGAVHDRDINAARNLETVARGLRDTLNACVTGSLETEMIGVVVRRLGEHPVSQAATKTQECSSNEPQGEL